MRAKNKIDVLYIHPSGNSGDYNIPMGVLGLLNSIDCVKAGKMYFEVTDSILLNSKIIAIDCHWYFSLSEIGRLAKDIKKINPRATIIVGGQTATALAGMMVKRFKVDYVVRGDGEIPFPLLVKDILGGGDGRDVPNIASRRFINPQTYHLTEEDYNKSDCITIDWFPALKERMGLIHNFLPFGYCEPMGLYPFIPVYKGCSNDCDFCFSRSSAQRKLYGRGLVARSPEMVVKDLQACSQNKDIKQVYMISDFVNILGEGYANKVFSGKYDVNLYYEFEHFNSPSTDILGKMTDCFNKCYFTFIFSKPFHRHPGERFDYLLKVLNYFKSLDKEITIGIYTDGSKSFDKYYGELKRAYGGLVINDCKGWFEPVPLVRDDDKDPDGAKYFNFWRREARKMASRNFVARSGEDDNSRFYALLRDRLMAVRRDGKTGRGKKT